MAKRLKHRAEEDSFDKLDSEDEDQSASDGEVTPRGERPPAPPAVPAGPVPRPPSDAADAQSHMDYALEMAMHYNTHAQKWFSYLHGLRVHDGSWSVPAPRGGARLSLEEPDAFLDMTGIPIGATAPRGRDRERKAAVAGRLKGRGGNGAAAAAAAGLAGLGRAHGTILVPGAFGNRLPALPDYFPAFFGPLPQQPPEKKKGWYLARTRREDLGPSNEFRTVPRGGGAGAGSGLDSEGEGGEEGMNVLAQVAAAAYLRETGASSGAFGGSLAEVAGAMKALRPAAPAARRPSKASAGAKPPKQGKAAAARAQSADARGRLPTAPRGTPPSGLPSDEEEEGGDEDEVVLLVSDEDSEEPEPGLDTDAEEEDGQGGAGGAGPGGPQARSGTNPTSTPDVRRPPVPSPAPTNGLSPAAEEDQRGERAEAAAAAHAAPRRPRPAGRKRRRSEVFFEEEEEEEGAGERGEAEDGAGTPGSLAAAAAAARPRPAPASGLAPGMERARVGLETSIRAAIGPALELGLYSGVEVRPDGRIPLVNLFSGMDSVDRLTLNVTNRGVLRGRIKHKDAEGDRLVAEVSLDEKGSEGPSRAALRRFALDLIRRTSLAALEPLTAVQEGLLALLESDAGIEYASGLNSGKPRDALRTQAVREALDWAAGLSPDKLQAEVLSLAQQCRAEAPASPAIDLPTVVSAFVSLLERPERADVAGDQKALQCSTCRSAQGYLLMLCETCLDGGTHTFCSTPPTLIVPEGDYYCPACCKNGKKRVGGGGAGGKKPSSRGGIIKFKIIEAQI